MDISKCNNVEKKSKKTICSSNISVSPTAGNSRRPRRSSRKPKSARSCGQGRITDILEALDPFELNELSDIEVISSESNNDSDSDEPTSIHTKKHGYIGPRCLSPPPPSAAATSKSR